jgi:hypothetical protein
VALGDHFPDDDVRIHEFSRTERFGISFAFGVALWLGIRFQWMKDFGATAPCSPDGLRSSSNVTHGFPEQDRLSLQ